MRNIIRKEELPAFPVVVVNEDFPEALKALLQCHGIGGLRPNTLLLGWSTEAGKSLKGCENSGRDRCSADRQPG